MVERTIGSWKKWLSYGLDLILLLAVLLWIAALENGAEDLGRRQRGRTFLALLQNRQSLTNSDGGALESWFPLMQQLILVGLLARLLQNLLSPLENNRQASKAASTSQHQRQGKPTSSVRIKMPPTPADNEGDQQERFKFGDSIRSAVTASTYFDDDEDQEEEDAFMMMTTASTATTTTTTSSSFQSSSTWERAVEEYDKEGNFIYSGGRVGLLEEKNTTKLNENGSRHDISVIIHDSVEHISEKAFCKAKDWLWDVQFSETSRLASIGVHAFRGLWHLHKLPRLPPTVRILEKQSFHNAGLKYVDLGHVTSLLEIGEGAFYQCTALQTITLPNQLERIGRRAFCDCYSLTSVLLADDPDETTEIESRNENNNFEYKGIVGKGAFKGLKRLAIVQLPKKLVVIDSFSFEDCDALKYVHLSEFTRSIGARAFVNCSLMETIQIPHSVQHIGARCFYGCSLLKLIRPPEGCIIGEQAFDLCYKIKPKRTGNFELTAQEYQHLWSREDGSLPLHRLCFSLSLTLQQLRDFTLPPTQSMDHRKEFTNYLLMNPLHVLTFNRLATPEMMETLIEICTSQGHRKNFFVSGRDSFGVSPIHYACCHSNAMVQVLFQHGALVSTKDKCSRYPLHYAAMGDKISKELVDFLIQQFPAAASAQDQFGKTPLHYACQNSSLCTELVKSLTLGDSDSSRSKEIVIAQDRYKRTALHYACQNPQMDYGMMDTLCQARAVWLEDVDHKCATALSADFAVEAYHRYDMHVLNHLYRYRPVAGRELSGVGTTGNRKLSYLQNKYLRRLTSKIELSSPSSAFEFRPGEDSGWVVFSSQLQDEGTIKELVQLIDTCSRYDAKTLANATDHHGRKAIDTAVKPVKDALRSALLFCGRYDLGEERPDYESKTCKVYFGVDLIGDDGPGVPVAMKFFFDSSHYEAELNSRLKCPGDTDSTRFDGKYVIGMFDAYDGRGNQEYRIAAEKNGFPMYCMVLERGERNLTEMIQGENMTASPLTVCAALHEIAACLKHMHDAGFVHGDVKPKNIVRHMDTRRMKLIDLDGAVEIGHPVGLKLSTAYVPPEIIALDEKDSFRPILLSRCTEGSGRDLGRFPTIIADPSFDVWSFGILMLNMVRKSVHVLDGVDLDDNLGEAELKKLCRWDLSLASSKLENVEEPAKSLLLRMLDEDPDMRPSMQEVLVDSYFAPHLRFLDLESRLREAQSAQNGSLADVIQTRMIQLNDQMNKVRTIQQETVVDLREIRDRSVRLEAGMDSMHSQMFQISEQIDAIQNSLTKELQSHSRLLKDIACADEIVPRYCLIVPRGRRHSKWWDSLNSSTSGSEILVYFLCPVTLEVPRDERGQLVGYKLKLPPEWIVRFGPALVWALRILPYALAIGRCTGFPLPTMQGAADNLQSRIEAVDEFESCLSHDIDKIKNASKSVDESSRSTSRGGANSGAAVTEKSVESVRAIAKMAGDSAFQKCGLCKAIGPDGTSLFVSTAAKVLYELKGEACFEMKPVDVSDEIIRLNSAEHEEGPARGISQSRLHQSSRAKTVYSGPLDILSGSRLFAKSKKRYFLLRSDGTMEYYKTAVDMEDPAKIGKQVNGVVRLEPQDGKPLLLLLLCSGRLSNLTLRAPSEDALEEWIRASDACHDVKKGSL